MQGMALRILIVPQLLSAQSKWKYESGLLLPLKVASHLSRRGDVHTHIAVPGETPFVSPVPRVTLHEMPPLYPNWSLPIFGRVASPASVINLIASIGPDIIVATNSSVAVMLATILDGDRLHRMGRCNVPLVMWDIQPDAGDIIERAVNISGSRNVASGFIAASDVWFCGKSTEQASLTEVRKWFGFSAEARVSENAYQFPGTFEKKFIHNVIANIPVRKRDVFTVHIGGRWSKTKNHDMVCKALMSLKAQGLPVDVVWTGPVDKNLERWDAEMGITLLEGLTQEEMWKEAYSCHVDILAQDPQALPCMPFEQMALGLPVLVRSTKHTPEVMPRYPLLFTDQKELTALLAHVMKHYEKASSDCAKWFEDNWDKYDVSLVSELIDSMIERFRVNTRKFSISTAGVVSMPNIKSTLIYQQSILKQTLARRTAIQGGAIEEIDSSVPLFRNEENND